MPSSSVMTWLQEAVRRLEESHPCDAQRVGEMAVSLLGDALRRQEELEKQVAELKKQAVVGKLASSLRFAGKGRPVLAYAPAENVAGRPRASRQRVSSMSRIVTATFTASKRTVSGLGRRVTGSTYSGSYTMPWLVDEYGPIVEVGEGVERIRWYDEDIEEGFTFPRTRYWAEDGEGDIWMTVTSDQTLWETTVRSADEIKSYGHLTLFQIADRTGSVDDGGWRYGASHSRLREGRARASQDHWVCA